MLVVHIGPRKTATTYLQQNFYLNRAELLARGWLYPVLSVNAQNAHHEVVSSLALLRAGRGRLVASMARAAKLAAGKSANILISSEGFRKWKPADFSVLGERLGQKDILIVYTLRDPIDMLVSVWGEAVKNGKAPSLKAYARRQLADPLKSPVLNCLFELDPIKAEPGLKLKVLDYEAIMRSGSDIYQQFGKHILGLEGLEPAKLRRSNESFSFEVEDYLRLVAREIDYDPAKAERLFSRQFLQCHTRDEIAHIDAVIRRADLAEDVPISRDEPWYAALQSEILQSTGPLIVPPPIEGEKLFTGRVEMARSCDMDALAKAPEIGDLLAESCKRMRAVGLPFKRGRIARAWRYLKRLVSV